MSLYDLYPSSTSICDFAYNEDHPLRHGQFPTSGNSSDIDGEDYEYGHQSYYDNHEGTLPGSRTINLRAVALFDFTPENDNEIELKEGQSVWISYRHGQGWLVAEDPELGKDGLVPEEYVDFLVEDDDTEDDPRPFMPEILRLLDKPNREDEWEDLDEDSHALEHNLGGIEDEELEQMQHYLQKTQIN